MSDLVEFLRARVAEAMDTLEHVIGHLEQLPHKPGGISVDGRDVYDVRRVLAECEAKRRIVEWCGEREMIWVGHTFADDPEVPPHPDQFVPGPLSHPTDAVVLRFLALPYADHPDYCEEWRP